MVRPLFRCSRSGKLTGVAAAALKHARQRKEGRKACLKKCMARGGAQKKEE